MNPQVVLEIDQLKAGPNTFLKGISFKITQGEFVCVIGPNGSGKTTLLKAISALIPSEGTISINGIPKTGLSRQDFAQQVAVVPNVTEPEFAFLVSEVLATGRFPYQGIFPRLSGLDRSLMKKAATQADILHLLDKKVTEISTGEYQRVLLARALCQQSHLLLLDEPTAHLDLAHQIRVFTLLSELQSAGTHTILCISHDLNLAAQFADRLILLSEGSVFADGTPESVLTSHNINAVYGADVLVETREGRPFLHSRKPLLSGHIANPEEVS